MARRCPYPWLFCVFLALVSVVVLYGFKGAALRKAARNYAYAKAQLVHEHFIRFGDLTNPVPDQAEVFVYTNIIQTENVVHECRFAMRWNHFGISTGALVVVTTKGDVLWVEPGRPPRRMRPRSGRKEKANRDTTQQSIPLEYPVSPVMVYNSLTGLRG